MITLKEHLIKQHIKNTDNNNNFDYLIKKIINIGIVREAPRRSALHIQFTDNENCNVYIEVLKNCVYSTTNPVLKINSTDNYNKVLDIIKHKHNNKSNILLSFLCKNYLIPLKLYDIVKDDKCCARAFISDNMFNVYVKKADDIINILKKIIEKI